MLRETPEEIAYELRAHEGALWTGSRMVIGIWAFAFAALGFAYFYLRSANNAEPLASCPYHGAHRRRRGGVRLLARERRSWSAYGMRRFRSGSELDWQVAGWTGSSAL